MFRLSTLGLVLGGLLSIAWSQNTTLINPRTRFSNMSLSLPPQSFPVLQTNFETPPDCGETSYRGSGRLRGRRALVTGGDSGIGRSIVIAYAREGASVAINYLPEEEPDAQDLVDFLARDGLSITRIPGNLLNETFCADLVHRAYDAMGGLDILVNNAGYTSSISGPNFRNISNHSTTEWDTVFRTNVYASFFTTRAAVPLMPPGASLIFTASNLARLPGPAGIDYSASKAAIVAMVRGLSRQLAPQGIRVNGVAPSLVYSPFVALSGITTEGLNAMGPGNPLGRVEQPAEVGPVYVDIAAGDKTFLTGSIWGDNGGGLGF